jgi:hypothetical protein
MSELVDRAVRALVEELMEHQDAFTDRKSDKSIWVDGLLEIEPMVRAVIEALREPTKEMVAAGHLAMPVTTRHVVENGAVKIRAIYQGDAEYVSPAGPWRAMVDAALQ